MDSSSKFLQDIDRFVDDINNGNSKVLEFAKEHVAQHNPNINFKKDIEKNLKEQAKTFSSDMRKVVQGEMSYAEMRGLYG